MVRLKVSLAITCQMVWQEIIRIGKFHIREIPLSVQETGSLTQNVGDSCMIWEVSHVSLILWWHRKSNQMEMKDPREICEKVKKKTYPMSLQFKIDMRFVIHHVFIMNSTHNSFFAGSPVWSIRIIAYWSSDPFISSIIVNWKCEEPLFPIFHHVAVMTTDWKAAFLASCIWFYWLLVDFIMCTHFSCVAFTIVKHC